MNWLTYIKGAGWCWPTSSGTGWYCVRTAMRFGMEQAFDRDPWDRMTVGLACYGIIDPSDVEYL